MNHWSHTGDTCPTCGSEVLITRSKSFRFCRDDECGWRDPPAAAATVKSVIPVTFWRRDA